MRTPFLVIASHRRWRGNPVNYARAYARLYYDWIATVAMLPRDDKKHHTQFPSMEGCRAAAGWSEKPRKYCHPALRYAATHSLVIASHRRWRGNLFFCCCVARALMRPVRILVFVQTALALVFTYSDSLRTIADGAAISSVSLCSTMCRSGAYAPCAYPRICSNCASACFHILFIPSAYACGYPRICSNCASACFHILGFIASHRRWRGNPVNKTCRAATQYLNFAL